jgi:hypothetical protein
MTMTLARRCSNCQRDNGTHAAWCDRDNNMPKREPDHAFNDAAMEVLGLFGNGLPQIKVLTDRTHVKTCILPEDAIAKVNRLRDEAAKRGKFPKLP